MTASTARPGPGLAASRLRPWSSPLGWLIAVLLAAAYVGAFVLLETAGRTTPPTPLSDIAVAPLKLEAALDALPDAPPLRTDRDATPLLLEAARLVAADISLYERFLASANVSVSDLPRLFALDPLLEQAELSSASAWSQPLTRHIAYRPEHPEVTRLVLAGRALGRVAMNDRSLGRTADAARSFHAMLRLGHKLWTYRTTYAEMSAGLGLMSEATAGLRLLHPNDEALAALAGELQSLTETTYAVWTALSTVDPDLLSRHNGDVCRIARDAQERVWRVEATLKLGRMKYNVGRRGTPADQRQARRLISQLRNDPDPAVALAAQLAADLTLEQYRTLR
ncbi:MAG: hypothetical protein ACK4PI_02610 [Tepidisphaerales bacterium]